MSCLRVAENHEFRENLEAVYAEKLEMFRNRLVKLYRHRKKLARKAGITCYRLYDHDLPEFPFSIDIYNDQLYVSEYKRRHGMAETAHEEWLQLCIDTMTAVTEIPPQHIHNKLRQRKAGRQGQYQKLDEASHEWPVQEGGLQFLVNLEDYLDTGLFLDHRVTRDWVRLHSAGKYVLNLFAYTGSFSVYAAAGAAEQVCTVDLSNTYLNWARRNMELNGFVEPDRYSYVQADVKQYLRSIPANSFDLIVMDPPTFSNSKKMDDFLDVQRDHVALITEAANTLRKGGEIIFSTNYRRFELDHAALSRFEIKDITRQNTAIDFEGKFSRLCYLIDISAS